MADQLAGSCLCGAIRYRCSAAPRIVGNCYCVDCRKSSGTSHCTHAMVPESALEMTGEVRFHDRPADSGNIVSRGFCPTCGSPVLSRNSAMPGAVFIRVSSLDDPDAIAPQMTVYASRAPSWAILDTSHPVFQEMPPGAPSTTPSQG